MDPSYSPLFTAGLLNCSTPRASLDLLLPSLPRTQAVPLSERRRSPPPPPLIITTTPARPHSNSISSRRTPRTSLTPADTRRRRSTISSPAYSLKSPTRAELRSRELQAQTKGQVNFRAWSRDSENVDKEEMRGRPDSGLWSTPIAALSRLRRRPNPLSAPSPPPSKPLPELPTSSSSRSSSPRPLSLKGVLTHLPTANGGRKPLSPLDSKSFFSMDDDEEM